MTKLGLLLPYTDGMITSPSFLRRYFKAVEELGVESVWAVEHVVVADAYEPRYPYSPDGRMPSAAGLVPMPDPLELLAFAAAVTDRLVLGTCVVVAPLHSPTVLAKRAATLDRLTEGRFLLGLGIGWQAEEYAAVGAPFARRGARLEDGIGAMRALWSQSPATYDGTFTSFDRVHQVPSPGGGAVPIVLGGHSDPAVERAGRLADGWFPYTIGPDDFEAAVRRVREASRAAGRPTDAVEITVWPGSFDHGRGSDPELAARYVAAGADRLVLRPNLPAEDPWEALDAQVSAYRDALSELTR